MFWGTKPSLHPIGSLDPSRNLNSLEGVPPHVSVVGVLQGDCSGVIADTTTAEPGGVS